MLLNVGSNCAVCAPGRGPAACGVLVAFGVLQCSSGTGAPPADGKRQIPLASSGWIAQRGLGRRAAAYRPLSSIGPPAGARIARHRDYPHKTTCPRAFRNGRGCRGLGATKLQSNWATAGPLLAMRTNRALRLRGWRIPLSKGRCYFGSGCMTQHRALVEIGIIQLCDLDRPSLCDHWCLPHH